MDNNEVLPLSHRETTQDVILENLAELIRDHEKRIRYLERFFNYAIGAIGLISFLSNFLGNIKH